MKRTPLHRKTPLRRTGRLRSGGMLQVRRRTPQEFADRVRIRATVYARDGERCRLDGHEGHECQSSLLTVHHLLKASQGGPYSVDNLVTLCAEANDWVEDNPDAAHSVGLVCRRGETVEDCWVQMRKAGLVAWGPWGEWYGYP